MQSRHKFYSLYRTCKFHITEVMVGNFRPCQRILGEVLASSLVPRYTFARLQLALVFVFRPITFHYPAKTKELAIRGCNMPFEKVNEEHRYF